MYRVRDIYLKKVYNYKNKLMGIVEDIYVDLRNGEVLGLKVARSKLFFKKNFIDIKKIIMDEKKITAIDFEKNKGIEFKKIKNMEFIDENGRLKGVVEDIFIDNSFVIKGFIVSSGIFNNITKGKDIFLTTQCEYKDKVIIYKGHEKICLKTFLHGLRGNYEG